MDCLTPFALAWAAVSTGALGIVLMRYEAELRRQGASWCDGCQFYKFYQDARRPEHDDAPAVYEDVTVPDEIPLEPRSFLRR